MYLFIFFKWFAFHTYMHTLQFSSTKKNRKSKKEIFKNAFFLSHKLPFCLKADQSKFGPLISKIPSSSWDHSTKEQNSRWVWSWDFKSTVEKRVTHWEPKNDEGNDEKDN